MPPKPNPRLQKIQGLLRRNDWKQAYKETKFLAKQSNDPELRPILITSLWNWIKDQQRRNQREEAAANVREMLAFRDVPPEILAEFPTVFRSLGLTSLLPAELQQDTSSVDIQVELVDLFILRNGPSTDLLPEVLADAERIREAFQKIETKQDDEAIELIRPIAFRSPLADWRLFLRGLIDYNQENQEQAEESWKRLSPQRPPFRIAEKLRKILSESKLPSAKANFFGPVSGSVTASKTELLDAVRSMEQYVQQKKYKELVGRFQAIRSRFRESEPLVVDRLLRLLQYHLTDAASPDVVRHFVERNLPLPLDPQGNRTLAFLSSYDSPFERPNWLNDPEYYWQKFADEDIDRLTSFSDKMKARAKSVAYGFIARLTIVEFFDVWDRPYDNENRDERYAAECEKVLQEINELLDKATAADPAFVDTYYTRQNFFLKTQPEDKRDPYQPVIAAINENILEHIPEHDAALEYLFEYHILNREPAKARPYFDRIRAIDPLSRKTTFIRCRLAISMMRLGLRDRDFVQTAAGFECYSDGPPLESILYRFDLIPMALAYINDVLQGKTDTLGDYFAIVAQKGVEKRFPLIFTILVEGRECGVPETILAPLEAEWKKAISGRCNGNMAGALGDLVFTMLSMKNWFQQAGDLMGDVCNFVNRADQVKWNCEKDLFGACELLWRLMNGREGARYQKTFETLVKKGRKQFPESPYFLFFEAENFMPSGPSGPYRRSSIRQARKSYEEFLKRFISLRNDPTVEPFIIIAEKRLRELDQSMMGGFPFSPFASHNDFDDDDDDFDDDDDDDDFDDDDFDDEEGGGTPGFLPNFGGSQNDTPPPHIINILNMLDQTLSGAPAGSFQKVLAETMLECMAKGMSREGMKKILLQKMEKMPPAERQAFEAFMKNSIEESDNAGPDENGRDNTNEQRNKNKKKGKR